MTLPISLHILQIAISRSECKVIFALSTLGLRGCWFSRRVRRVCVRFPIVVTSPPVTQHWHSIDSLFARGDNRNRPRRTGDGGLRCRNGFWQPRSRPIDARANATPPKTSAWQNAGGDDNRVLSAISAASATTAIRQHITKQTQTDVKWHVRKQHLPNKYSCMTQNLRLPLDFCV